ncbi:MAG: DUF6677 family protein [Planctomycetota bacterium]
MGDSSPGQALMGTASMVERGLWAYLIPGLGYVRLRDPRRGALVAIGVFGLLIGGLLIGGIDVIDRKDDFWWFIPQSFVGPIAFLLDHLHRNVLSSSVERSIGRVNEVGTLFVVMAGMLNLIAILDCALEDDGQERRSEAKA